MSKDFKIPEDLIESIQQGNCVVFVGAGLGKQAGLPLWDELLDNMKNKLLNEINDAKIKADTEKYFKIEKDPLELAQWFKDNIGNGECYQFLTQQFRNKDIYFSPAHRELAHLPVNLFITTNYDKLLESALREVRVDEPRVIITSDQLAANYDANYPCIIKFHGDIDNPKSIILTRDDYTRFRHTQKV
jgi:NAD-dependent SIR2 family protein deacetylase